MGRFEGFYTGEESNADNGSLLDCDTFARRRLKREKEQAKAALLDKWKAELKQCSSRKSLRNYIETYKSETENPYVRQAEDILDNLDFHESQGSEHALTQYIENHSKGKHIDEARKLISQLRRDSENRKIINKKREETAEGIFVCIAIAVAVIILCCTELNFFTATSIGGSIYVILYKNFIKPIFFE